MRAVLQFILSPLLIWKSFFSAILSNIIYLTAFGYYHYMSFLGYSALPFLEHTEVFLWPIAMLLLSIPFSLLFGFNPSCFTLALYFG